MGIRPEHFKLNDDGLGKMDFTVDHLEILGADTLVYGHIGESKTSLTVRLPALYHFDKNKVLPLTASSGHLHLFDKKSEKRIEK